MMNNLKKYVALGAFGYLCILGMLLISPAYGQDTKNTKAITADSSANQAYFDSFYNQGHTKPTQTQTAQVPQTDTTEGYWVQDRLCIMLLLFAFLLCSGEIILFLKGKMDQQMIIKLIILTLVIFAILFLITAGYDNSQTQTSVGLLGTIAGYLLGRAIPDAGASPQAPGPAQRPAEQAVDNN